MNELQSTDNRADKGVKSRCRKFKEIFNGSITPFIRTLINIGLCLTVWGGLGGSILQSIM